MHRLILLAKKHEFVDHINGEKLDNRRANLRLATRAENNRNRRNTPHTSRYKGVSWENSTQRWKAQIRKDYKTRSIGRFSSEDEAARAYDCMAIKLFGEFARLNFPAR